MPPLNDNWHQWRGAIDEKMNTHASKLEDHCERIAAAEQAISKVLVKLAVPLFVMGIAGPVIGAIIVFVVTNALKH